MIDIACKKIAHICGPEISPEIRRQEGYEQALAQAGMKVIDDYIITQRKGDIGTKRGGTQSGIDSDCPGHSGVGGGNMAAPALSERDWSVRETAYLVDLLCRGSFCHVDWSHCVLRCAAEKRAVLADE